MTSDQTEDLLRVHQVLWDFSGAEAWEKAASAVARIEYLQRELSISQYNEKAALHVVQQNHRELERSRLMLANCATVMRANDPLNARAIFGKWITNPTNEELVHEQEARQASGPTGAQQERSRSEED